MISWQPLYAVAASELRQSRRLVRYWVFVVLAMILGIGAYVYYALIHGFFSTFSATVAAIGPRYLVGAYGYNYMVVMMTGVVFLGFDVRARDRRERMVEVLDVRPCSNLELVLGRYLGMLSAVLAPVVLLVLLLEGSGWLLRALGAPFGEPMETYSAIGLVVFMAIPCLAVTLALVFLVTLLVRNRLVAAVLLLALFGADIYASVTLPLNLSPLVDLTGAYSVAFPSELVPAIAAQGGWLQRLGALVVAAGLLLLAAAVHPRLDGSSKKSGFGGGAVLLLGGIALLAVVSYGRQGVLRQIESWQAVHTAEAARPAPDLVSVSGSVLIEPPERLVMSLDLRLAAPGDTALESLLLSLNPGLEVSSATDGAGRTLAVDQHDGLLELGLTEPLPAGAETAVHLEIDGRPDLRFGYLDSARRPEALTALETQLMLLGYEPGEFNQRFVALMPGNRWLPAPGADVGRDDPRGRGTDYFDVDLEVEVPSGWLLAGPGRRTELEARAGGSRFGLAPVAPVDEVCLIASKFSSFTTEIDGVQMELLITPGHTRYLKVLAEAEDEIVTWVRQRLEAADQIGLGYPYQAFTLVEVPSRLRSYGGGWRMDTTLAPPAMALVREIGLPAARFDLAFADRSDFEDTEGGVPAAMRERLRRFFVNDFTGGNLFVAAARSFFLHQTSARGSEALALNFVLEDLTTRIVTDNEGYFSAHMFTPEVGQAVGQALSTYFQGSRDGNVAAAVIEVFSNRPEVWESVLGTSLVDLDPDEAPRRTLDALTLKGGALSRAVADTLGATGAGTMLAELRATHSGSTFTLADVLATDAATSSDLDQLLEDWLTTTALPGFVASDGRAFRLADAADGTPRYQVLVRVANDEHVPGFFRLAYTVDTDRRPTIDVTEPVRLDGGSAVRYGLVLSQPPVGLWVQPYLALNRRRFKVDLGDVDQERIVRAEPVIGAEPLPAEAAPGEVAGREVIIVDDLDAGFSARSDDHKAGMRIDAREVEGETDAGLPVLERGGPPTAWSRGTSPSAFGHYRHTFAAVRSGSGGPDAAFVTEVPRAGRWDLEVHLPDEGIFRRSREWGTWTLEITDSSGTTEAELNTAAATAGWNLVGSFELAGAQVEVVMRTSSERGVLVADAIRWTPAAGGGRQ